MTEGAYPFAARVLVRADTVRVIAEPYEQSHRFKQGTHGGKSVGRFVLREFAEGDQWPGEPIDETWTPAARGYRVTPGLNGQVLARLRRFPFENPEVGVVIGFTWRQEGVITTVDGSTHLCPPSRTVPLLEVAMATDGKAHIHLVHRLDAAVVPAGMLA